MRAGRLKMIRWIILALPSVNLWWPKEGAEASALAEQLTFIVRVAQVCSCFSLSQRVL